MSTMNETAHAILNGIADHFGCDRDDEIEIMESRKYRLWMRDASFAHDLYTDRGGEEDDDHPNFTGYEKVVEYANDMAECNGFHLSKVFNSEKRWFCVEITPTS